MRRQKFMKVRVQSRNHSLIFRGKSQNLGIFRCSKPQFTCVQSIMTSFSKELCRIAIKILIQKQSHEAIRSGAEESFILADANISAC